jgi:hypothetical protein
MKTYENFWAKVQVRNPDECWEWQGAKTSSGYGNLSWCGVQVQAHRVAYFFCVMAILNCLPTSNRRV